MAFNPIVEFKFRECGSCIARKKKAKCLAGRECPPPCVLPLEPKRRSKQVSTGRCIPSTEVRVSVLFYWSTALMAPKTTTQRLGQTRDHSREPGVKP